MQAWPASLVDMLGKTYATQVCSAARTLEQVGERWSLLIVRDALFAGSTHYSDFLRLGVATNILKDRLAGFVEHGIMERREAGAGEGHHAYVLTAKGRELAPVIIALTAWGDRWLAPKGPPIRYTHATCGHPIREQTTCAHCGEVREFTDVLATPGPGMPADRAKRILKRLAGR